MLLILLLNALILIPIFAYWLARRKAPHHVFCISGAAFGAIVSPLSLGLYWWFHVSAFGLIPGLVGLVLALIHETPGFQLAVNLGLFQGVEVAFDPTQHAIVEAINAVVWSFFYGLLGYVVDRVRKRNKKE